MRRLAHIAIITAAIGLVLSSAPDANADAGLVTKPSAHAPAQTLDRLTAILKERGISIFARIDHAAGAREVGSELPPTEVLVFGNPRLGTPLMQSNRAIGLDLPLRVLAWQDGDGKSYVTYLSAEALKARHAITDRDPVFQAMREALEGLTQAASKAE